MVIRIVSLVSSFRDLITPMEVFLSNAVVET